MEMMQTRQGTLVSSIFHSCPKVPSFVKPLLLSFKSFPFLTQGLKKSPFSVDWSSLSMEPVISREAARIKGKTFQVRKKKLGSCNMGPFKYCF